jgi:hypothetical protein
LKVKIPLMFEADGEGLWSVLCTAGLCALVIVLVFLAFWMAPSAVTQAIALRR